MLRSNLTVPELFAALNRVNFGFEPTFDRVVSAANCRNFDRNSAPTTNLRTDDAAMHLDIYVPGVPRERLSVSIEGDTLQVQASAPAAAEGEVDRGVRGPVFRQTYTLGEELDAAAANAALKDGVLTVTIPKRAQVQPRRIEVQVS